MLRTGEQENREKLQSFLIELSSSQDLLKTPRDRREYYFRLEGIYSRMETGERFRHYYSDIFAALSLIEGDPSLGNLDILAQNLETIKEGYVAQNKSEDGEIINISREIIKLYDHVNLDIARINYSKQLADKTLSELENSKQTIADLQKELKKSEEERAAANKRLETESTALKTEVHNNQKAMQSEYITILGIFASIVLAFTGGMSFSTSVLNNIGGVSAYRLIAAILLLGFVLVNLVWLLIDFLRDINGKTIRKWWIVVLADTVIIVGLFLTLIAYKYQWLSALQGLERHLPLKLC